MANKRQKNKPQNAANKSNLPKVPKVSSWANPGTAKFIKKVSIVSIAAQVLLYLYSQYLGGYKILTYMFFSAGKFDDLRNGVIQNKYFFDPELLKIKGFASVASPPMVLIWRVYQFFVNSEAKLLISIVATYAVLVLLFWLITKNAYATIVLATLHPILFTFARGNPDMWVLILICIAGMGFIRGRNWLVAIAFGLMSALKFPYLLFGIIFLMKKDFKNLALQIAVTATAFLLPLNARPWGTLEQIRVFNGIVAKYYQGYVVADGGLLFNISLFGFEKPLLYLFKGKGMDSIAKAHDVAITALELQVVSLIALLLMLLAIPIFYQLKNEVIIRNVTKASADTELYLVFFLFLAVVECLYPQVAAEYRLAQLVVIIALLFKVKSGFLENRWYLVTLGLICLPKHFMVLGFPAGVANITTISSLITPLLLVLLAFQIQIYLSKNAFYSPFLKLLRIKPKTHTYI